MVKVYSVHWSSRSREVDPASEWFSSLQRNRVCGYTASVERTPAKVLVNDGTTFTQVDEGEQRNLHRELKQRLVFLLVSFDF